MKKNMSLIDHEKLVREAYTPDDNLLPVAEEVLRNHKGVSVGFAASRMGVSVKRAEFLLQFLRKKT